jgi:hypothetical protein
MCSLFNYRSLCTTKIEINRIVYVFSPHTRTPHTSKLSFKRCTLCARYICVTGIYVFQVYMCSRYIYVFSIQPSKSPYFMLIYIYIYIYIYTTAHYYSSLLLLFATTFYYLSLLQFFTTHRWRRLTTGRKFHVRSFNTTRMAPFQYALALRSFSSRTMCC